MLVDIQPFIENTLRSVENKLPIRVRIHSSIEVAFHAHEDFCAELHRIITCLSANVSASTNGEFGALDFRAERAQVGIDMSLKNWDLPPGDYLRIVISNADFQDSRASACLIFEPFFNTEVTQEDNGFNLAQAYKKVLKRRGSITAKNDGSDRITFEVYLPVDRDLLTIDPPNFITNDLDRSEKIPA